MSEDVISKEKLEERYKKVIIRTEETVLPFTGDGFSYKVVGHKTMFCKSYMPNRKGGHRHNHIRNATSRMRRCNICDKPITKYEGFSMRFYGHICMECRKLDVEEYCQAVGLNLSPSAFSFLRNPYIRRKRK